MIFKVLYLIFISWIVCSNAGGPSIEGSLSSSIIPCPEIRSYKQEIDQYTKTLKNLVEQAISEFNKIIKSAGQTIGSNSFKNSANKNYYHYIQLIKEAKAKTIEHISNNMPANYPEDCYQFKLNEILALYDKAVNDVTVKRDQLLNM
ncbi:hypothetical protein PVAND_012358 [Polypedilum vanderplanki]|uniref:Uncharacterized protein n=1 Tax=Polypedilum vanderplanki TaxID=319348 RepID=A0A9J6CN50_POLVA|nr:hypothetical protein PVAND_012358 [Polypedilum vanderplanki]